MRAELAVPTSVLRSYQRCRCSVCLGYGFAFYLRWNSKVGVYCKIRYNCLFVFSCLSKKTYFTRDTFETVAKCDNSYPPPADFAVIRKQTSLKWKCQWGKLFQSTFEKRKVWNFSSFICLLTLDQKFDYPVSVNLSNCSISSDQKPGYLIQKLQCIAVQTDSALRVTHRHQIKWP